VGGGAGGSYSAEARSGCPGSGPPARTCSTCSKAVLRSAIQTPSCWATSRTHHARASLRLRATPASTRVSSTWRSAMRRRVITGALTVVNVASAPPHRAPHETRRSKVLCASSAMAMRCARLSSRNPSIRARSAVARWVSSISGGRLTAPRSVMTRISSSSTVTPDCSMVVVARRPANQAAICWRSLAVVRRPSNDRRHPRLRPPAGRGGLPGPPRAGPSLPDRSHMSRMILIVMVITPLHAEFSVVNSIGAGCGRLGAGCSLVANCPVAGLRPRRWSKRPGHWEPEVAFHPVSVYGYRAGLRPGAVNRVGRTSSVSAMDDPHDDRCVVASCSPCRERRWTSGAAVREAQSKW